MSTSVPSPDKLIALSTYPTLQKVSEGDYNEYVQARKELKENLVKLFTQQGKGQYGHMGNIFSNAQYALITINTTYAVPPETGPLPVIVIGSTAVQSGNLVGRTSNPSKRGRIGSTLSKLSRIKYRRHSPPDTSPNCRTSIADFRTRRHMIY